jgi:hypothetical protein
VIATNHVSHRVAVILRHLLSDCSKPPRMRTLAAAAKKHETDANASRRIA